jgi:hypothetical protein
VVVHGWAAAPGGRGVDDVVVGQCAGVQQFKGGEQPQRVGVRRAVLTPATARHPPVGEAGRSRLHRAGRTPRGGRQLGVLRTDVAASRRRSARYCRSSSTTALTNSTADGAAVSTLSGRPFPIRNKHPPCLQRRAFRPTGVGEARSQPRQICGRIPPLRSAMSGIAAILPGTGGLFCRVADTAASVGPG